MWPLIVKDLSLQGRSLYTYFVLAVLASLFLYHFTTGGGEGIIYVVGTIAVMNVALRAAYEDDRNKGFAFLCSLPLKRSTVVLSKFTGSFIFVLAGFGAVLGIDLAMRGFAPEAAYWQNIMGYSLLPSGMLVVMGIFWLLFFRLGYIRAMNIVRFMLLAPLAGIAVASAMVTRGMTINVALTDHLAFFTGGFFTLALLAYGVMLGASLVIFHKADLG